MPKVCLVKDISINSYSNYEDYETYITNIIPKTDWVEVSDEEYQALKEYVFDYQVNKERLRLLSLFDEKEFIETVQEALDRFKKKKLKIKEMELAEEKRQKKYRELNKKKEIERKKKRLEKLQNELKQMDNT